MLSKTLPMLLALTLLGAPSASPARESVPRSGALEVVDPDGNVLGSCPLKHTEVKTEISGFVARVSVTQTFENPYPEPIEAIYTFPLSDRAAVDAMWIRSGEREIRGEIKRREEARRIYEAARERGQLAGLLDQERPNIFTQSVANILPGAEVEVHIEYVELLKYVAGTFEFSFPTVVGPRFIPGNPVGHPGTGWALDTARVADASHITPPVTPAGTRAGHDIAIQVEIDAGVPILSLDSRLHAIDVERLGSARARVRLRERAEIPNRDFVLRYAVAGEEVRSGFLSHRNGGDGYVSFILLPPKRVTSGTAAPKELIFVIDRSGSQSGRPLNKAKQTMLWILDHMNPNDTFQVVDFANTTNMLFERPERASLVMKRKARAYIGALQANGGTMMAEAVQRVCALPADQHRLRIVTFMTDGYIGNDFAVIDLVKRLRGTSRWFPFGTGNSVNRFLLESMAREGGGEVEYVLLNEPGDAVARRFYERIGSPVLTDVSLEFRNLDVIDVFPNQVADVWAERPLFIHARYRKPGKGQVILRGFQGGQPYRQVLEVKLPRRAKSNAALASVWARTKVDDLMSQDLTALQTGQFPERLREQIVEVALEHRIVTQFTSFVAVEDRVVNEGGTQRSVTVPVEMPQGVEYEGIFGEARQDAVYGVRLRSLAKSGQAGRFAHAPQLAFERSAIVAQKRAEADAPELARDEKPLPVSSEVRSRLAPELLALVEGYASSDSQHLVVRGAVKVKVLLSSVSDAVLQALKDAGLEVALIMQKSVVGSVPLSQLCELAKLDAVVRVELP
ncbi:MAG: VWA domain-containing protein [Deltaproteobacteria bacterium]|nr:MAG: VWA domain-containing protein [Deltaproteobacteria bacterium]